MQRQNQPGRQPERAQHVNGPHGRRRSFSRLFNRSCPTAVVQIVRAVDRDPDADVVAHEHLDVVQREQHAVRLDTRPAPLFFTPPQQFVQIVHVHQQRFAAEQGEPMPFA
jgi:hypothetical protein